MKTKTGPPGPSIAIVLGAGVSPDGIPTERTTVRAEAAARLAMANPEMTVILTGDGRTDANRRKRSYSEASQMAYILRERGISHQRLRLEHQSRDTMGNAILVAARFLAGQAPRKIYIVTSPFHAERALLMFRGVLGPEWPVELFASEVAEGDQVKASNEAGGIEWAHRFFEKTIPGNITSAINRLLEVGKPRYRSLRWLTQRKAA